MKTMNVSLVGVGGQGILLTSDILAKTAALAGLDVKKSEIHGMAQRGGSVISQVRFGEKVYSPIIRDGASDLLVSFERLEALRWRHLLAPNGRVLINDINMTPITVSSGQQPAVTDLDARLKNEYPGALYIDAMSLAKSVGNTRAMNMVVAGALSKLTPFSVEVWEQAMRERIPVKLIDMNIKAFETGRAAVNY
ncbi:MAG TPA: indolepyruvate oxidoreductase subunit beta [Kiritimatiellia bacterium]|nr:indolepyruvate oxidoreductase subunit beta [Kiritimatiellia bacterium]HPS05897.1 indolepyruvate oxidoreductase subunit beta [Kiritimatiellia bacterium]